LNVAATAWKVDCVGISTTSGRWLSSLVVWITRSGQREIVVLAAVRQRQLLDHVLEASFMDSGWSDIPGVLRGFFRVRSQRSGANGGNAYGY
jgi:hypothetical protein